VPSSFLTAVSLTAAADPAYAAGRVVGTLLIPVLGVILLVVGLRRRNDHSTPARGTALIVGGGVLLGPAVLGLVGAAAQSGMKQ